MKLKNRTKLIAFIAGVIAIGQMNVEAAVRVWNGSVNTNFNTAANWTTAVAPNGADEYSIGAIGTSDAALSANATINGLIFTNGRSATVDIGTFALTLDGGATPDDLSITGLGHVITGDKTGTGDLLLGTGALVITANVNSSLRIDATIDNPGTGTTTTRFIKSGPGLVELAADSSAVWNSVGNPSPTFAPVTVRAGVLVLNSIGARGASTNNVAVYQSTAASTNNEGGGTLRLAADFGEINDFGGTNNTQGFLELSGRGWTGGTFPTGEGALHNTIGNNSVTTTNGGEVRLANNGDIAEDAVRIRVAEGTNLTFNVPVVNGALFNPTVPNFEKTGSGLLVFNSVSTYTGNTDVLEGTLEIGTAGTIDTSSVITVNVGANFVANYLRPTTATIDGTATTRANGGTAGASKVETLTIGIAGKLNLKDNDLVVGTAANVNAVRSAIKTGVAGAAGITSDLPAFGVSTGFGFALGNDSAISPLLAGSLSGQSYDADSVLVKYTYLGDADLDGDSDLNDLGLWAQSFTGDLGNPAIPATYWTSGDFDYDGDTDLNDLGFWAGTFTGDLGGGAGSLIVVAPNAPAGAVAALNSMGITVVPEPSTFVLAGVGIVGLALLPKRRAK